MRRGGEEESCGEKESCGELWQKGEDKSCGKEERRKAVIRRRGGEKEMRREGEKESCEKEERMRAFAFARRRTSCTSAFRCNK